MSGAGAGAGVKPYRNASLSLPQTRQEWLWQRLLVEELPVLPKGSAPPDCFSAPG